MSVQENPFDDEPKAGAGGSFEETFNALFGKGQFNSGFMTISCNHWGDWPGKRRPCLAEQLLDHARSIMIPKGGVMHVFSKGATEDDQRTELARCKLAIDLWRAPIGLRFRAVYEEWDHERLIREMY